MAAEGGCFREVASRGDSLLRGTKEAVAASEADDVRSSRRSSVEVRVDARYAPVGATWGEIGVVCEDMAALRQHTRAFDDENAAGRARVANAGWSGLLGDDPIHSFHGGQARRNV